MKSILISLTAITLTFATTIYSAETKQVCVDRKGKDGKVVLDKAGKAVQDCKTIKVHKKLEGTKVPEKNGK